jgi:hypothetical protein
MLILIGLLFILFLLIDFYIFYVIYLVLRTFWRIMRSVYHEIRRRLKGPSLLRYDKDTNSLEVLK